MKTSFARFQPRLLLVLLGGSLAMMGRAQDFGSDSSIPAPLTQSNRFAISPFYGYRFGGSTQDSTTGATYNFEDAPAYGLFLDYAPKGYIGRFELLWSRQESSMDFNGNYGLGQVDLTIDEFQFGGVAEYGRDRLRGYASAHLGATYLSSDGYGDDLEFSFSIGGGVKAFLTKNIYLRADLCGFCTVVEAQGSFIYVNGVTVVTFSGSTLWQGQATVGVGLTF